jgi:hypothetical protein
MAISDQLQQMETSSTQRIQSDIVFDGGIFSPDRVPETTSQINSYLFLQSLSAIKGQEWWEVSIGIPLFNVSPC